MATVVAIDPVTRLEGHLRVEVQVGTVNGVSQVVDAHTTGTLFRGFEKILIGRPPQDAQHLTQRICGVCPVSHGMASVQAQEAAAGVSVPANGRILRDLVLGANFLQSHLLHFYHLALQDFVDGPNMPPWQPSWAVDKRFSATETSTLVSHYVTALDMRRKAHELGAIFGGRMPCPPSFLPGGCTAVPTASRIGGFSNYLTLVANFINRVYIPDVAFVAKRYDDYFGIGVGPKNLLAYGVFSLDATGTSKLLTRGRVVNGSATVATLNPNDITESVALSWYADATAFRSPSAADTVAQYPKTGAYSWLKSPRLQRVPYEVGALARMWVNGDYRRGISVMDRHRARAAEAAKVAEFMRTAVARLAIGSPVCVSCQVPGNRAGIGMTEAPRGALGHWLQTNATGQISRYQIITPTCWNASPRDVNGVLGPIETALIGTPVQNPDQPVEVVRVIHSFDPCLSCAVHVMRAGEGARIFRLGHGGREPATVGAGAGSQGADAA